MNARRPAWRIAIELAARFAIAAVFAYAAVGKLGDVRAFGADVANYQMLPGAAASVLAVVLPTIELAIALALVSGIGARSASLLASVLFVVFAVAMAHALARGIDLSCGCFGTDPAEQAATVDVWTIARNVALATLAAVPLVAGVSSYRALLAARHAASKRN